MGSIVASIWLHPWDAIDEGIDVVLGRIQDMGIRAVSLAVSYHCGSLVLPHNPKRRFYFADEGVVYFKPDETKYSRTILKPKRSAEYGDALSLLQRSASKYGISVNGWTVCFHNSRFAREHPHLALLSIFGDRNLNFLCPTNSESRNYLRAIVTDLASHYELDLIKLESATFPPGVAHGDHHEMFATYIEPFASHVLSTCFCDSCTKTARSLGFDLEAIQRKLRGLVDTSMKARTELMVKTPSSDQLRMLHDLVLDMPELYQLLTYKSAVVDSIFREAKEVIKDTDSTKRLSVAIGADSRTIEGVNLRSISRIVDQIDLGAYFDTSEQVYYYTRWAKEEIENQCKIEVALTSSYPMGDFASLLPSQARAAVQAGADGLSFYNYGMTHEENFHVIKAILSELT